MPHLHGTSRELYHILHNFSTNSEVSKHHSGLSIKPEEALRHAAAVSRYIKRNFGSCNFSTFREES